MFLKLRQACSISSLLFLLVWIFPLSFLFSQETTHEEPLSVVERAFYLKTIQPCQPSPFQSRRSSYYVSRFSQNENFYSENSTFYFFNSIVELCNEKQNSNGDFTYEIILFDGISGSGSTPKEALENCKEALSDFKEETLKVKSCPPK